MNEIIDWIFSYGTPIVLLLTGWSALMIFSGSLEVELAPFICFFAMGWGVFAFLWLCVPDNPKK